MPAPGFGIGIIQSLRVSEIRFASPAVTRGQKLVVHLIVDFTLSLSAAGPSVLVWRSVVVTAFTVASLFSSILYGGAAHAGPADTANFLLFGGTDLWRYGDFLYGGAVWSPGGLNKDGFALKVLLNGGAYNYKSGDLHGGVDGDMFSATAMPGWRFTRGGLS